MHIFFSGIGGAGIGPLALVAKQAGYQVSGSDKQDSNYIDYLRAHGLDNIHIGQDKQQLAEIHQRQPIDWFVYSSAVIMENPNHPEIDFCKANGIKTTKRDELLNQIITDKNLKLVAVAGTHGKTTTTAMLVWLFKQLNIPISYSVPAKLSYGEMGEYVAGSEYFIYEADEFDHNFLAFHPYLSLITGIDWDHPDIFPTREVYEQAFVKFVGQSAWTIFWKPDFNKLKLAEDSHYLVLDPATPELSKLTLAGLVNRQDAWQVVNTVNVITFTPKDQLIKLINEFPGLARRFEKLADNVYSDYVHTPGKIRGALQLAHEVAGDNVVVVYEGLHNTRQHFIKDDLSHLFDSVKKLYIVPSYQAREDQSLALLTPQDLANLTSQPNKAIASKMDGQLLANIKSHQQAGDLVLCLSGGGGASLDEWLRQQLQT